MPRLTAQALVSLLVVACLTYGFAAGPAIGIAIATGTFQADHSSVFGNTTLFEGTLIETNVASSRLRLKNGTQMELAADSRATVFGNRLLLEKGLGELAATANYRIEARSLRVATVGPHAIARVRLEGATKVQVAAVDGPVRVFNKIGLLVANLKPGNSLSFEPQAGQENSFDMTGCLLQKQGKFVLANLEANQVVELRGAELDQHLRNRIRITGMGLPAETPVSGASQVIQVEKVEQVSTGGCLAVADQINADPLKSPTPPPAANSKHTGAIIAGVAVAAGVGIGAAVALGGKKSTSP